MPIVRTRAYHVDPHCPEIKIDFETGLNEPQLEIDSKPGLKLYSFLCAAPNYLIGGQIVRRTQILFANNIWEAKTMVANVIRKALVYDYLTNDNNAKLEEAVERERAKYDLSSELYIEHGKEMEARWAREEFLFRLTECERSLPDSELFDSADPDRYLYVSIFSLERGFINVGNSSLDAQIVFDKFNAYVEIEGIITD